MNLRRLSAVSFGHMAIDILNASIAMILAVLAVPFNITNAQIGLGGMAYALMGSLTQPFFGVLADRFGGRWLGAVGLLWTAVFYYAATFSQNYFTLITLMTVASLGSGAFHPQGAMNAGAAGGHRATTGTSVFFLLGQMGLALGPMIAGVLLEEIWMLGPRIMAIATLPFVVWMAIGLRKPLVRVEEEPPPPATLEQRRRLQRRVARALALGQTALHNLTGAGWRWWPLPCWWRCGLQFTRSFMVFYPSTSPTWVLRRRSSALWSASPAWPSPSAP